MKKLLFIGIVCIGLQVASKAQETTIFYQSNSIVANSKDNAKFYVVYKPENDKLISYQRFSIDNVLLEKGTILNMQSLTKEGKVTSYYSNGNIKDMVNYEGGLPSGEKLHYFNNGSINYKIYHTAAGYGKGSAATSSTKYIYCANPQGKIILKDGNGEFEEYGTNQQLLQKGTVAHTLPDGIWKGYEDGNLLFLEAYKKGNLIKGETYTLNGSTHFYTNRNSRPKPKGGINDFYNYIAEAMQDMAQTQNGSLQGQVVLKFIVESTGQLKDIRIVKSASNPRINAMAVAALTNAPKWTPATELGQPVDMAFFMPITMR
jgi:TonB family protein